VSAAQDCVDNALKRQTRDSGAFHLEDSRHRASAQAGSVVVSRRLSARTVDLRGVPCSKNSRRHAAKQANLSHRLQLAASWGAGTVTRLQRLAQKGRSKGTQVFDQADTACRVNPG